MPNHTNAENNPFSLDGFFRLERIVFHGYRRIYLGNALLKVDRYSLAGKQLEMQLYQQLQEKYKKGAGTWQGAAPAMARFIDKGEKFLCVDKDGGFRRQDNHVVFELVYRHDKEEETFYWSLSDGTIAFGTKIVRGETFREEASK